MRLISPTQVYLEEGEIVPVFCVCGTIYQPEKDSEKSVCPKCFKTNFHDYPSVLPHCRH